MGSSSPRARFRVVASVGRVPGGERFILSSESWTAGFRAAFAGLEVSVDRSDLGARQVVKLAPRGLSELSIAAVIRSDVRLTALTELAERAATMRDEELLERLAEIAGDSPLPARCRVLLAGGEDASGAATIAVEPDPLAASSDPVDALFARTASVPSAASTSAVDSFVSAIRGRPNASAIGGRAAPSQIDATRKIIVQHVDSIARAVLADPTVARMESGWRSLRWLLEHCPPASGLVVEVIDAPLSKALDLLADTARDDDFEQPDLLAVAEPVGTTEQLSALAQLGAAQLTPCVAAWASALEPSALEEALAAERQPGRPYAALLEEPRARWLCLLWNSPVVHEDASGVTSRAVFGSPVWALLAGIAASYAATGSFARILGNPGSVRAPATTHVEGGRDGEMAIPTARFVSIRSQAALADSRVVALGSGRNSDRILLATAPTLSASSDAVPLPAQIVTGRVARFAEWVARQVPAGAPSDDVRQIFEQASSVFLFPGISAGMLTASTVVQADGRRLVRVRAEVPATHAGVHLDLQLDLPLR